MSQISHLLTKNKINSVDTDIVLVAQGDSQKPLAQFVPEAYREVVGELADKKTFTGKLGSSLFIRFGGVMPAENLMLVGVGAVKSLNEEKLRIAMASVYARLKSEKVLSSAIHFDGFEKAAATNKSLNPIRAARAIAEGLTLPAYDFEKYKSGDKKQDETREYTFISSKKSTESKLAAEMKKVSAALDAIQVTRDWSNEPSNFGTPEYYAAESVRMAKKLGIKAKVLTEADCKKEKMGLFLGVGQGSEREGKFVVLEYSPKAKKKSKTIALVGKGITFDSGGISIKPSLRMEEMKHDMTGAATVFGATLLAAAMGCPNRIVTIMAFTENMPDGNAIQPGNVIAARNGKTVEILNTDAEGRLILADALDYAQDFNPDYLINAATLTGAVGVALGRLCCGIMGNDDKLVRNLIECGESHGEKMWELPLWDEYFDDLKSDCADMKNVANDGYGGTIRGGIFLKQFIRKGVRWAHLDIALSSSSTPQAYYPRRGANGQFVRSIAEFAMNA